MDDDLDTPGVVADMADLRRRANALLDAGDAAGAAPLAAAVLELAGALGLRLEGGALGAGGTGEEGLSSGVADAVRRRDEARARRDWATADAIRRELEGQGWVVEDTPRGTRLHR
jgi:cysteinyl-tRNA synthetase